MDKRFNVWFLLMFIPIAFMTYLFHEFGHWTLGEIFGNDMVMNLNYCWPKSGTFLTEQHELYSAIGGPLFTILQALIFWLVIEKFRSIYAYPFVYFAFFVRFFSIVFGGFAKQDEAGISVLLGIGKYTVAIIVLSILTLLVVRTSRILNVTLKSNCILFAVSTIAILIVIGSYSIF